MLLIFVKWFFKPLNYFSRFILSCYFLDSEFYVLSIHTLNIEKYCTFCDSYVQNNTYAVTYCAVDYRILIHILDDRWSFNRYIHIHWELLRLTLIYYDPIRIYSYFRFWYYHWSKKLLAVYASKEKDYFIHMKTLPDHNLRREFAVGAVAVISHNIWKSKLYINTEGQLFWYLNTF